MHRLKNIFRALLSLPAAILYLILFFIPMVLMLRYSFATSENLNLTLIWTLDNYATLLNNDLYLKVILRSLYVAGLVSIVAVLIGFPAAWILARAPERHRNLLLVLLIVPWWASYIVRVFGWYILFGNSGVINKSLLYIGIISTPLQFFTFNLPAVIITEVNLFLPLMIIPIYMTLEKLDFNLILASRSLGATRLYTFIHIIIPLSLPSIIAGVIFIFMPVSGSFIVPQLLGGTRSLMVGNVITSQFGEASNWALGSALAIILTIILLIALWFLTFCKKRLSGEFY
jgi:spermidine/putrescine transport system permease protein